MATARQRLLLIAVGTAIGVALCEASVRLLRPDLGALADAPYVASTWRIFGPQPNTASVAYNPDTKEPHLRLYNSLALRQHREFSVLKPSGTIRIGFFGDSFTENYYMPVPYAFTEPLDYVLNQMGTAPRYEVLNFGVSSYGPDQYYLRYLEQGAQLDLDTVVFMYTGNDLRNIVANNLLSVGDDGRLRNARAPAMALWKRAVRRLTLTYLVLEAAPSLAAGIPADSPDAARGPTSVRERQRLQAAMAPLEEQLGSGVSTPDLERSLRIFLSIVRTMRDGIARRGGRFLVAIVPLPVSVPQSAMARHEKLIEEAVEGLGVEALNLAEELRAEPTDFRRVFWRRDGHWNAEGNKLATIHLLRRLGPNHGVPNVDDHLLGQLLYRYYHSFDSDGSRYGLTDAHLVPVELPEAMRRSIVATYTALNSRAANRGLPF